MSGRVNKVQFQLDSKGINYLPHDEIAAILRGADDLIMRGGRTLLSKLLKGSKEKNVLEYELDKNPVYGFYSNISTEDILAKIDWMIQNGYLRIEYDYRLPLLVYTGKGWEIEKDTYTTEMLEEFDRMISSGADHFDMNYLKERDRGMILMLLEKVKLTKDKKYIPLLQCWKEIDYKKIKQEINRVIDSLSRGAA